jgi:hypothetical protein
LLTLFCSLILSTDGCVGITPMVVTLFVVCKNAQDTPNTSDLIWHKQVHLKVSVMVWRLLRKRLQTKDNLVICDTLFPLTQACAWLVVAFWPKCHHLRHKIPKCHTFKKKSLTATLYQQRWMKIWFNS